MPKYKVTVRQEWVEYGEVEVEADNENAARAEAQDMLSEGDIEIEWLGDNMDPGQNSVESVEEIECEKNTKPRRNSPKNLRKPTKRKTTFRKK